MSSPRIKPRMTARYAKMFKQDDAVSVEEDKSEKKSNKMDRRFVLQMQFSAHVAEGETLYHKNEFKRAIVAFTQALDIDIEDIDKSGVYLSRANCYIQTGDVMSAMEDIKIVFKQKPDEPLAFLARAEAFFTMGEFEIALVYFYRGLHLRKDMVEFQDGITKSRNAIIDSINGRQPTQSTDLELDDDDFPRFQKNTTEVMKDIYPDEEILPLTDGNVNGEYLGDLQYDYAYLKEIYEESKGIETKSKKDEEFEEVVVETIKYLNTRSAFWSQQGNIPVAYPSSAVTSRVGTPAKLASPQTPTKLASPRRASRLDGTRIQDYERKYGTPRKAK